MLDSDSEYESETDQDTPERQNEEEFLDDESDISETSEDESPSRPEKRSLSSNFSIGTYNKKAKPDLDAEDSDVEIVFQSNQAPTAVSTDVNNFNEVDDTSKDIDHSNFESLNIDLLSEAASSQSHIAHSPSQAVSSPSKTANSPPETTNPSSKTANSPSQIVNLEPSNVVEQDLLNESLESELNIGLRKS